jgi:hypothetical protein
MTEYGRIHTDGSRSGGQPVLKPCPCCETEAVFIPVSTTSDVRFRVKCCNDGCGLQTNTFASADVVVEVWNTRQPTQSDALREALERIEAATRNEVRAGDKGYISRYGINGIARAALQGQSK